MLPIKSELPIKDKVQDVRQVEIEKQEKLIGKIKVNRGHTLYEINLKAQTIEPAQFEDADISFGNLGKAKSGRGFGVNEDGNGNKKIVLDKLGATTKKLLKKKDCIYIAALNRKNIVKKLIKKGIVKVKID